MEAMTLKGIKPTADLAATSGRHIANSGRLVRHTMTNPSYKYDYHLDTGLEEIELYRDLTEVLANATEYDEVHLYINGPGGYVSSCLQIVNLIQNCRAQVVGHLLGYCRSAHSFIFLACHSFVVYHNAELMAHNYSGGAWGKGNEVIEMAEANKRIFNRLVDDVYYPFFTEEEVDSIRDNRDIWLSGSEEIMPRIERLVEYREKLAAQRELQAAGSLS